MVAAVPLAHSIGNLGLSSDFAVAAVSRIREHSGYLVGGNDQPDPPNSHEFGYVPPQWATATDGDMNVVASAIDAQVIQIGGRLAAGGTRVVLAESCTGGLVSALLTRMPGMSQYLCGSAVTYREATKTQWLDVAPALLERYTAVSGEVATQMAVGALVHTPEADVAVSVTGHLGPDAPPDQDGLIYIGLARRAAVTGAIVSQAARSHRLTAADRVPRQEEAALQVLMCLHAELDSYLTSGLTAGAGTGLSGRDDDGAGQTCLVGYANSIPRRANCSQMARLMVCCVSMYKL